MHARGFGAHGYFENYEPLTELTRADLFQRGRPAHRGLRPLLHRGRQQGLGRPRPRRARLRRRSSTPARATGTSSATTSRSSSSRTRSSSPTSIHAAKQEPDRGFPQAQTAHDNFWDFASLSPESTAHALWIMSDRAIPRSFRFMEGFGVHTFRLVNARGPLDVRQVPLEAEAGHAVGGVERGGQDQRRRSGLPPARPVGRDPARATIPEWELGLQLFDDDFADKFDFDVLDPTKIIPEEVLPVRPVGRLVLDRVVDNFFAETEQVAFCTQNVVPGHRLHQRPAAAGPQLLLPGHAAQAAGQPELHPPAGQRAARPRSPTSSRTATWRCATRAGAPTTSRTPGRPDVGGPREDPARGFVSYAEHEDAGRSAGCARRASPTTTARRGSSTSARPRSSSATSPTRSSSS